MYALSHRKESPIVKFAYSFQIARAKFTGGGIPDILARLAKDEGRYLKSGI